jgi:competence ComEA-like helix-hairpin-helix protein
MSVILSPPRRTKNLSAHATLCHSEPRQGARGKLREESAVALLGGCPMRRCCAWGFFLLILLTGVGAAGAQKKPPAKPIDINTASIEQLEQLPGIGKVTAKSIFDFRKRSGPFRRTEDLLAIRGISEKRFKAIAPYVTVSQAKSAAPPKAAAPKLPAATPKATAPKPAAPPR